MVGLVGLLAVGLIGIGLKITGSCSLLPPSLGASYAGNCSKWTSVTSTCPLSLAIVYA